MSLLHDSMSTSFLSEHPREVEGNKHVLKPALTRVVPINRLIGDLAIFTFTFDDQSQFLKTNFCCDYLHMIKRHTFCFSYLCLIKKINFLCFHHYFYFVSAGIILKFQEKWTTHDVWCTCGRVNVHEKTSPNKNWSSIFLVEWWSVLKICTDSKH